MTATTLTVAQDLTQIARLAQDLDDQAEHLASAKVDGHGLPGGLAMVALAPVANTEAWRENYFSRERNGRSIDHIADEDDEFEPPLQTLLFWSEQWRAIHGAETDQRPTIATETAFIRWALDWAWDNELHFEDFAEDVRKTRVRLENLLYAGERVERGVPCMYDECGGRRLFRTVGAQGQRSDWACPSCERTWTADRYDRMVMAAIETSRREFIDGEEWSAIDRAARLVKRPVKTLRTWVNRGEVATVCIVKGQRDGFVSMMDVREVDERKQRRRQVAA